MAIEVQDLEGKHPSERIQYTFNLVRYKTFGDGTDTVSSVEWYVYLSTNLSSNLSTAMVAAKSHTNTSVSVEISNGATGVSYYVVGLITAASGRKYIVMGRFAVNNQGIALT